jgi:hypothetical protein
VTLTPLFALFEFNMTNQNLLPLYDRILLKYTFSRVMDSITLLFLILLLGYRGYCIFYTNNYTFICFVALFCESWFTFTWILTMNLKWNPAYTITHLDRLLLRYIVMPSIIVCYSFLWFILWIKWQTSLEIHIQLWGTYPLKLTENVQSDNIDFYI